MINPYAYSSPTVDNLPKSFVEKIIKKLNSLYKEVEYWLDRYDKAEDKYDIKYTYQMHLTKKAELFNVKKFLNSLELYPVWSMPGYRGTYHIPNYADCDRWQVWIDETCCGEEY